MAATPEVGSISGTLMKLQVAAIEADDATRTNSPIVIILLICPPWQLMGFNLGTSY
jgi:hypothetical protein